jgi:endonuclease-3
LLVAVILSAQATDKGVNKATAKLFPVANTPQAILDLGEDGLKGYVKTIGLFNSKAANIIKTCRILVDQYDGQVPAERKALEALPGVGRKTANVVLGNAFGVPAIACDTHVLRLARRLELSEHADDPVKLEFDLGDIVPKKGWTLFSHLLIFHGRRICTARKPGCPECPIAAHCPAANRPDRW